MSAGATPAPAQELAERWGLRHLGGRPTLPAYIRQLWQRRHFGLELARSRFRAENEADRLGVAWIILRPLINAAVYGTVFGVILVGGRSENYVPYLVSGVFMFQFFAACLTDGSRSIINNMGLVTTLHFPRAVLPISVIYQQLLALLWMMLALMGIVMATGTLPRVSWLEVIPATILFALFNLGVAFMAARITIHLRDVAQLIPFVNRMFFYLSGVFTSMQYTLREHQTLLAFSDANPIYVFITLIRVALLGERSVFGDPKSDAIYPHDLGLTWAYAVAWALGMLAIGFVFFWRAEDKYGRE